MTCSNATLGYNLVRSSKMQYEVAFLGETLKKTCMLFLSGGDDPVGSSQSGQILGRALGGTLLLKLLFFR